MDVEIRQDKIKQIRGKGFVMAFARRIVMAFPQKRKHFTFEFQAQKKRVNIHETIEPDGPRRSIVDIRLDLPAEEVESWLRPLAERLLRNSAHRMAVARYWSKIVALSPVVDEAWLAHEADQEGVRKLDVAGVLKRHMRLVSEQSPLPAGNYLCWKLDRSRGRLVFGGLLLCQGVDGKGGTLYISERALCRFRSHCLTELWPLFSFPEDAPDQLKVRAHVRRAISSLRSSRRAVKLSSKG